MTCARKSFAQASFPRPERRGWRRSSAAVVGRHSFYTVGFETIPARTLPSDRSRRRALLRLQPELLHAPADGGDVAPDHLGQLLPRPGVGQEAHALKLRPHLAYRESPAPGVWRHNPAS